MDYNIVLSQADFGNNYLDKVELPISSEVDADKMIAYLSITDETTIQKVRRFISNLKLYGIWNKITMLILPSICSDRLQVMKNFKDTTFASIALKSYDYDGNLGLNFDAKNKAYYRGKYNGGYASAVKIEYASVANTIDNFHLALCTIDDTQETSFQFASYYGVSETETFSYYNNQNRRTSACAFADVKNKTIIGSVAHGYNSHLSAEGYKDVANNIDSTLTTAIIKQSNGDANKFRFFSFGEALTKDETLAYYSEINKFLGLS